MRNLQYSANAHAMKSIDSIQLGLGEPNTIKGIHELAQYERIEYCELLFDWHVRVGPNTTKSEKVRMSETNTSAEFGRNEAIVREKSTEVQHGMNMLDWFAIWFAN